MPWTDPRSTLRRVSLAATLGMLAVLYALPAAAQWAWRDSTGRTVYSDQPPPASVKPSQVLRQPSTQSFGTPAADNTPAPETKGDGKDAPKTSGPKTLAEREMESRKRSQEAAENEKKQAEEQARTEQVAAECQRMRGYLRSLEDGQRIARTDAQGNREFLDDAQRASEVRRVRDGISRNCS